MRIRNIALALPLALPMAPATCTPPPPLVVDIGMPTPGDCDSYVPLFEKYGLPVATFKRIAWRESGCNHLSYVVDSDDEGGGLLGINFKGRNMKAGWMSWCGATVDMVTDPEVNVHCAAEAYQRLGLRPWGGG
jgi:hypothetical protein